MIISKNDDNQGPWGSGGNNQNPWGRKPSNNQQQPDMDEILKQVNAGTLTIKDAD